MFILSFIKILKFCEIDSSSFDEFFFGLDFLNFSGLANLQNNNQWQKGR